MSKYFKPYELLHSNTATQYGISNTPTSFDHVQNLLLLVAYLDKIREAFGRPIHVNSGYRTPDVNARVGGEPTSLHMRGLAADLRPSGGDRFGLYLAICSVIGEHRGTMETFDNGKFEVCVYGSFIHFGINK